MRTISWKSPFVVLFVTGLMAACGSDDSGKGKEPLSDAGDGGGAKCGNGKVEGTEMCDKTDLGGDTCSTASMGNKPSGTLKCSPNCTFDLTSCTGGGTGGSSGSGGAGGGGTTGNGGGGTTGSGGSDSDASSGGTGTGGSSTGGSTSDASTGGTPASDASTGGTAPTDSGPG